jgi:hypothetical protein
MSLFDADGPGRDAAKAPGHTNNSVEVGTRLKQLMKIICSVCRTYSISEDNNLFDQTVCFIKYVTDEVGPYYTCVE